MRLYVDIGVNLGLQFIIRLLITHWACGFSWIILPQRNPTKKKRSPSQKRVLVGSVGSYDVIRSNPTWSYIQSYHFYDLATILNFLMRWDRKIVRSYDPNRDFDNHSENNDGINQDVGSNVVRRVTTRTSLSPLLLAFYFIFFIFKTGWLKVDWTAMAWWEWLWV